VTTNDNDFMVSAKKLSVSAPERVVRDGSREEGGECLMQIASVGAVISNVHITKNG
jgi:hypothetical protein